MITKLSLFESKDFDFINDLDIELIQKETENNFAVPIMYIAQFPDITTIHVPHFYTKKVEYINIETYLLTDKLLDNLNKDFKEYGIKLILSTGLEKRFSTVLAQKLGKKVKI